MVAAQRGVAERASCAATPRLPWSWTPDHREVRRMAAAGLPQSRHHRCVEVSDANRETIDKYSGLTDEFYDRLGEDGGFHRRALLNPAIFHLLGDVAGTRILDAGCGHGYLSPLLA